MAAMNVPRPLNERTGYGVAEHLPVTAPDPPPSNDQQTLNQWIKTQPWYQEALKAWHITPGSPTLNPTQRLQLQEAAFRAGAQPASTYAIGNHGEFEDTHELAGKVIALTIGGIAGGFAVAPLFAGGAAGGATAAGTVTPALAGEAGVTTGLSTALPGAIAAPTLASSTIAPVAGTLAPTVAPALTGTTAATTGTVASTAGPGILSKTLGALTSPAVLSTIASGAFGVYGASKAADSQTDAAKIIADANTAAAKLQADASTQAAQIQAKSTADALDFAKQGYADQSSRYEQNQEQLSPYTGAGGAAVTKLSQLLGLGTPAPYVSAVKPQAAALQTAQTATPKIPPGSEATGPNSFKPVSMNPTQLTGTIASLAQSAAAQTPSPSQQMVTLRAPTGETTQKPASEVQHWVSLGAQPVQQGAAV